jgi:DoxX-like family
LLTAQRAKRVEGGGGTEPPLALSDQRWLRVGVAAVWLATGALVVFPLYRAIGATHLARLGLPAWLMWVTCVFEVGLAFFVALRRATLADTLLQASLVGAFSVILAVSEPRLLVSPFGMLTKNVPIVAAVVTAYLLEREGWSPRALALLRVGMAAIWISEGLIPKILFQQQEEILIAVGSGLAFGHPRIELAAIGLLQLASGILAIVLRPGRILRLILAAQLIALFALPALVSLQVPWLWLHPFGPFTKNLPIAAGTWVLLRKCSSSS